MSGGGDAPITVIVCSRDRAGQLATALPAVRASLRPGDRALVVDSASTGPETRAVAANAGLECVRVDRPGLARARNAGLRHARTPLVAFTDDDCRPDPAWLDALRRRFREPGVAFVTGRVAASSGAEHGSSVQADLRPARFQGVRDPHGIGHGANMAFRRDVVLGLGGFDERLGAGAPFRAGEDHDMLWRILDGGHRGAYDPDALVTHDQWRDPGAELRLRFGYGVGNGACKVKMVRALGAQGLRILMRSFWDHGVVLTLGALKHGSAVGVARGASWSLGMLVGIARFARLRGPKAAGA